MSEEFEAVLKQMQELTDLVKDHRSDPATLDFEQVQEKFSAQIEAMVQAQVKDALDKAPVRRVPGNPMGPEGDSGETVPKTNRYFPAVKDLKRDGKHRHGSAVLRPVDLYIAQRILDGQVDARQKGYVDGSTPLRASEDLRAAVKALSSTGAGSGDELVPTGMAAQLWQDIFLKSLVVAQIETIPMPTNPFDVPLGLGDVTWRKGSENTATSASDPATAKSTLTATELITEQNWSYTLNEDAVIAMAPAIRERLAISGAEIIDDFALNADSTNAATGNINSDDADPDNDSYYLSDGQDGLRHLWLADNTGQGVDAGGDALGDADILAMLAKMGKYAVNPEQVRMVCDVATYLKGLLNLDAVITVDKFGANAVVVTGQLAAYRGVPIIVSASARKTEADGKRSATSGNNTLGQITAFNRLMWYAGFLRDLLIEVDRDIQKRQYIMVTSLREAIAAHGTRSSATHTAGIRNISVA